MTEGVLGIRSSELTRLASVDVSLEKLRRRWRVLAVKNHPDRGGRTETIQQINQHYDLATAAVRRHYESSSGTQSTPLPSPPSASRPSPENRFVHSCAFCHQPVALSMMPCLFSCPKCGKHQNTWTGCSSGPTPAPAPAPDARPRFSFVRVDDAALKAAAAATWTKSKAKAKAKASPRPPSVGIVYARPRVVAPTLGGVAKKAAHCSGR